jgi:hypothetical protein
MLYNVKDEAGKELTDDKLRNEIIFADKKDMTYTYFDGVKYDIEKVATDRSGFKELKIRKG